MTILSRKQYYIVEAYLFTHQAYFCFINIAINYFIISLCFVDSAKLSNLVLARFIFTNHFIFFCDLVCNLYQMRNINISAISYLVPLWAHSLNILCKTKITHNLWEDSKSVSGIAGRIRARMSILNLNIIGVIGQPCRTPIVSLSGVWTGEFQIRSYRSFNWLFKHMII